MKQNKKKVLIIIAIGILVIVAILVTLFFIQNSKYTITESTTFVSYDKRNGAILSNVYTTYIEKYYNDQNTLVIFWASWCHNCQSETEAISTLMAENPDRKIIVVSHDKTENELRDYLIKNNLKWFVIYDPTRIIRSSIDKEANSIPNTYLLNNKGEVINHKEGSMQIEELRRFLNGEAVE